MDMFTAVGNDEYVLVEAPACRRLGALFIVVLQGNSIQKGPSTKHSYSEIALYLFGTSFPTHHSRIMYIKKGL